MATPAEFTKPVNIGNPGEFAIPEIAQKVIALTGSKSNIAPGFRMATPSKTQMYNIHGE